MAETPISLESLSDYLSETIGLDGQGSQRAEEIRVFIRELPEVKERDLGTDETCPICQETFLSAIAAQELAFAMDTPGMVIEDLGVVKLPGCGHRFCRKDILIWAVASHSTCPACRNKFLPGNSAADAGRGLPAGWHQAINLEMLLGPGSFASEHPDADASHHNPFSEGSQRSRNQENGGTHERASTAGTEASNEDMEDVRSEIAAMRALMNRRTAPYSESRESFSMYS